MQKNKKKDMEMQKAQEKLTQFDKARGWDKGWHLKDLCLNIIEEVGEFWNLIKWIDSDKQKEIIKEKKRRSIRLYRRQPISCT